MPLSRSLRGRRTVTLARSFHGIVVVRRGGTGSCASQLLTINPTEACVANPDFQPALTGGDGNDVQLCEVLCTEPVETPIYFGILLTRLRRLLA